MPRLSAHIKSTGQGSGYYGFPYYEYYVPVLYKFLLIWTRFFEISVQFLTSVPCAMMFILHTQYSTYLDTEPECSNFLQFRPPPPPLWFHVCYGTFRLYYIDCAVNFISAILSFNLSLCQLFFCHNQIPKLQGH